MLLYGNNKYEILEFVLAIPLSSHECRFSWISLLNMGTYASLAYLLCAIRLILIPALECRCGVVFDSHYVIFSRVFKSSTRVRRCII